MNIKKKKKRPNSNTSSITGTVAYLNISGHLENSAAVLFTIIDANGNKVALNLTYPKPYVTEAYLSMSFILTMAYYNQRLLTVEYYPAIPPASAGLPVKINAQ